MFPITVAPDRLVEVRAALGALAIANAAAGEVDGVDLSHGGPRLPGDNSPTVGAFLGNMTGTRAAVDLTINVVYGRSIPEVTGALRRNVVQEVGSLTGLEATEVTITVNDLTMPQQ